MGETPELLGRGRSGVVYRVVGPDGAARAQKVFGSRGLEKLVQYIFFGAPNPYLWSRDAIDAAVIRRRVLGRLVKFWFGDRLRVVPATGAAWLEGFRAQALEMELVSGRHFPLRGPYNRRATDRLSVFLEDVLAPLQAHLLEAGCDGQLWQAGYGNPVGLSNFMVERDDAGNDRPVWVDLESGVPALFALHPGKLLGFYLRAALRRGHALFDEIDVPRALAYVSEHRTGLVSVLGEGEVRGLAADLEALGALQARWHAQARVERSIEAAERAARINAAEAAHFRAHPVRWYAREAGRMTIGAPGALFRRVCGLALRLVRLPWRSALVRGTRAMFSHAERVQLAHDWVLRRAAAWRERKQLSEYQHAELRAALTGTDESVFLADFGMHLATKPLVKLIEFGVLPLLVAGGWLSASVAVAAGVLLGGVVRSAYTLGRIVQAHWRGGPKPWLAFWVGLVPVVGNVAFPIELLYAGRRDELSLFLVYDTLAAVGRRVPIWGGQDTLTEHAFNRAASWVLPNRKV